MTLIEVLVALGIAVFLAMAAAPYFGDYLANSRLREGGNLLLGETLFAQSEALKRNASMRVDVRGATVQIFDLTDPAVPALVRSSTFPAPIELNGSASYVIGSDGRPVPFGTEVSVNLSSSTATCTADRRCPGLRVDAGGAVRLCGDHTAGCS